MESVSCKPITALGTSRAELTQSVAPIYVYLATRVGTPHESEP